MNSTTKRQVLSRISVEIKSIWFSKFIFISVSR